MNEISFNKKSLLFSSPRNKRSKYKSKKRISTISHVLRKLNLTPLEEKVDTIKLNKIMMESVTGKNSNNNSRNKYKENCNIPKMLQKNNRDKLFYLRNKNFIKTENICPYIWTLSSEKKKIYFKSDKDLKKVEKKEKILTSYKTSKMKDMFDKKKEQLESILIQKDLFERQQKEMEKYNREKRNIKIKMYKLIKKNGQMCQSFEKKNESFNLKFKNYFNSKHYINSKRLYNTNFRFSKNELNMGHDLYKQYLSTYTITKNSLNLKDVFNSLDPKEKKIIEKEPDYFFRDNNIFEIISDLEKKPLYTTLNEEEEVENMVKNNSTKKQIELYKEKNDIINQKLDEYMSKNKTEHDHEHIDDKRGIDSSHLFFKETIKIVKEKLDERLKPKTKTINEIINDELKICERNTIDKNNVEKLLNNKKYNLTYNKRIDFVTKLKSLKNNKKRLYKEKLFHKNKKTNTVRTEDSGDNFMNVWKKQIHDLYSSKTHIKTENNSME